MISVFHLAFGLNERAVWVVWFSDFRVCVCFFLYLITCLDKILVISLIITV